MMTTLLAVIALSGWKGETVSFRHETVNKSGSAVLCAPAFKGLPAGWTAKAGVLRGVRYSVEPYGEEKRIAPDRVEWNGTTNLLAGADCVTVGSVVIPASAKAGDYAFTFNGEKVTMHVANRTLPPPAKWKSAMNMWHNPFSIARLTNTKLWSPEHFEAMKPFMAFTAAWGQTGICTSISDYPWNHQCYDGYKTMIRHIKNPKSGAWTFDYTVFDKWVEYNFATGNGRFIECYSLCPWGYEVTWEDTTGHPNRLVAKPGTKEFEEYWGPFLKDFAKHLKAKGWLEKTRLSFDERDAGDMKKIIAFLEREAPEFNVSACTNENMDGYDGVKTKSFCVGTWQIDRKLLEKCHARRAKGIRLGSCYVCCAPEKPNNFLWSDPDDHFWIQVFPVAHGLWGSSRWTIDSWGRDPMNDADYYGWPASDTYFVYPDASPSIRYLLVLNGVQNAEKWRILYDDLKVLRPELDALAEKYDIEKALTKKDGDFREVIAETLALLNETSPRPAKVKVDVDAAKVKCEISPWLYGTGMEDVNHEIYGGLDAQRLYGESFEEPCPSPRQGHDVSASWDKAEALDGADFIRDTGVVHQGKASQSLIPNGGVASIGNKGLRRWGVPCREGKKMLGYVWTRGKVTKLEVALQDYWGEKTYALAEIPTQEGTNWCKVAFALTPSATDAHGRFLIRATGTGRVWLDDVYLADEPTNEFGRLGCREDIVAAFQDEGVTFLRWGGSMVNTPDYKLKNMAGKGERRPYTGLWFRESSGGFGPYEFVRMANAMKLPCSVAINAYDTVEDAVRFATELKRYDTPIFVQIGNEEIVNWAQNPQDSRTMKGVSNYCAAVRRLVPAMRAANPKLKFTQSAMVMGNCEKNLMKAVFHGLDGVVDYWDVHVGVVEPAQVRRDTDNASLAMKWLKEWNPKTTMKVMILEENGNNHGLDRALGHAVMLEKARAMGPDMLTSCPANALQPYLHNDNWWDQGAIFFTPTQVWLSPCGQAQKMASAYHRELLVEGRTSDKDVSVSATKARDGKSLVLHFVNTARTPRTIDLQLAGASGMKVTKAVSLSGTSVKADNSPSDPLKVAPRDVTVEFLRSQALRPYSYTVLVVE